MNSAYVDYDIEYELIPLSSFIDALVSQLIDSINSRKVEEVEQKQKFSLCEAELRR